MFIAQPYNPAIKILVADMTGDSPNHLKWNHDRMAASYWRLYWAPYRHFRMILNSMEFQPDPNNMALIPPHTPFDGRCDEPLFQFLLHFTARSPFDHLQPEIFMIHVNEVSLAYIRETIGLLEQKSVDELRINTLAIALAQMALLEIPRDRLRFHATDPRIIDVLRIIDDATSRPPSVETLAQRAGLNINSFIRLFKQHTGFTPQQYGIRKRIEKAGLLLEQTSQSIDEIAEQTGFCQRHHFTRSFTAIQGLSPAAYRKKNW